MLSAAGQLDPTFGAGGEVLVNFPGTTSGQADATLVLPNDETIVAGSAGGELAMVRLLANGMLDTTFGNNGYSLYKLPGPGASIANLALEPDGRILAAGTEAGDVMLARYNADGTLDTTFANNGYVTRVGSQPSFPIGLTVFGNRIYLAGDDNSVSCYQMNGALDTSFGGGTVNLNPAGIAVEGIVSVGVQSSGKVVVAGFGEPSPINYSPDSIVARLNQDGTLDTSFGNGAGYVLTQVNNSYSKAETMVLRPDNSILVAGRTTGASVLASYDANGNLVTGFGTGGTVVTSVPGTALRTNGLAVDSQGRIVTATTIFNSGQSDSILLARYSSSGVLDSTFGTNGLSTVNFNGQSADGYSVAIQPFASDRIIVAGVDNNQFMAAGFVSDGPPASSPITQQPTTPATPTAGIVPIDVNGSGQTTVAATPPTSAAPKVTRHTRAKHKISRHKRHHSHVASPKGRLIQHAHG